jgi:glycerate-2-kinase
MMEAGIRAADAGSLVERALATSSQMASRRQESDITVIAVGKASPAMAAAAVQQLGSRVRRGLLISATPVEAPALFSQVVGGHPTPSASSEVGGQRALALARSVSADQVLLVLLSGGASALMAVPAEGVTLDDKRATTERMLRAGADIHAMNRVRKHLSAVKGGRLAICVRGRCVCLRFPTSSTTM